MSDDSADATPLEKQEKTEQRIDKAETTEKPSEAAEEKSEEQLEQTTEAEGVPSKKKVSYTYWVDEKNKSRELPQEHRPKKIESPAAVESKPSGGPSHWNKSGTWEERAIPTKELAEACRGSIEQWMAGKELGLVLTGVELEGEFKRIFSNNKRKVMYELSGKIDFEGEELFVKLEEFTCSGDQEYSVRGKKGEERERLRPHAPKLAGLLVQVFNSYKQ